MPRKPSDIPWFHKKSGYWCGTVQGRRIYLDREYGPALARLKQLREGGSRTLVTDWFTAYFWQLADEFLDHIQAVRKQTTYDNYRYALDRANKILGNVRVCDVKRFHLSKIEQALHKSSPSTVFNTIAVVQAVFGWACRTDLLTSNPVSCYAKPSPRGRSRLLDAAELRAILRLSDPPFRLVLGFLRSTGCRPHEVRSLTWEQIDLVHGVAVLPEHKTSNTQKDPRPRILVLSQAVLRRLLRSHHQHRLQNPQCLQDGQSNNPATSFVFLNQKGLPYTKDCLTRKFARLRVRAGIPLKHGERLVLYSARHAFATNAVGKVSDKELAEILGHTDTRMLRKYVHLNTDRLKDIRRRIG